MSNQSKSYLFAVAAVLCWSTVGSAFKLALEEIDYFNLLFWSVLVSFFVFVLFLSFQKNWGLIKQQKLSEILKSAIMGLMNPFLYYFILFQAYDLLLAQEALTLNYLWPVVLVILSVPILKQKISIVSFIAILISFAGSFVIATGGNLLGGFSNLYGVVLAVLSTILWALFWIFNIKDKRKDIVKLFMNFSFGLIYILILSIFFGKIEIPNFKGVIAVTYIGIFEMGITFFLWLKALSLSKTTAKVSNLIYFAPFISLLLVNLILGEEIKIATIIGLIMIIAGIIIQKISSRDNI